MHTPNVVYVAGPETGEHQARSMAAARELAEPVLLQRRGTALGWIAARATPPAVESREAARAWHASEACLLSGQVRDALAGQQGNIEQALSLMHRVAGGDDPSALLSRTPYLERTDPGFELLIGFQDEGDEQEIETVEYDAMAQGEVSAENLWCKASWLSFEEDDSSLRFRFSFGLPGFEDVAADPQRELAAAALCEAVFPESALLSRNPELDTLLREILGLERLAYVERILYFNAPNGGAQFHQDLERGHLGVVFAQLHGRTGWLACAKTQLVDEIQGFVADPAQASALAELLPDTETLNRLQARCADRDLLAQWLDERDNEPLELLLNRCPAFCRRLVERGYGYLVQPGDVLLLPQKSLAECAWHTVFCLDDFPGESLSFAVRELPGA